MTHWLNRVVDILNAETSDLRELAILAGADPKTFYQFTNIDGLDVTGQNLAGMKFHNYNMEKMTSDDRTVFPIPPVDPEVQKAAETMATSFLNHNKPVPNDVALNVRALDLSFSDFTNAALLANIKWLQTIDLQNTKIATLTPLQVLRHLVSLNLGDTKIVDLKPISNFDKLQLLSLNGSQVADLKLLGSLNNLQTLWLNNTQVVDLSPISKLYKLEWIELNGTHILDLRPLSALRELRWLWLERTKITDWSPVAHVEDVRGRPGNWDIV